MKFSNIALFTMASAATAQDLGSLLAELPPDLASYAQGLFANTAVVGAVGGLIANTGVQQALAAIETGAPANPTQFVQNLESAVNAAISNAPSAQRDIVTSVVAVITSLGATDGLYSDISKIGAGGAGMTGSAMMAASTALSGASGQMTGSQSGSNMPAATGSSASGSGAAAQSSNAGGSSAKPSQGGAASVTGMAMGAIIGAAAVGAALL